MSTVDPQPGEPLTARQSEVLEHVLAGQMNKEIARELYISEKTVQAHLSHIYVKRGVGDHSGARWRLFAQELARLRERE